MPCARRCSAAPSKIGIPVHNFLLFGNKKTRQDALLGRIVVMPPKFHGKFFRLFSGTIIPSPRNAGVASSANRIPFRRRPLQSIHQKFAYSLTPTGNSLRRAIFATSLHHRFVGHILTPIFRFVNDFLTKKQKNTSQGRDVKISQNTNRDRKRRRNTFVKVRQKITYSVKTCPVD